MPLILECEERSYSLPDDTLVFALDDTGHESIHKENGACFGIGGCAFLVADYERLIEAPWNYMLQRFFPDTPRPIHSTNHLRNLSTEQLAALSHFFTRFQFFRLAVTVSEKTQNQVDVGATSTSLALPSYSVLWRLRRRQFLVEFSSYLRHQIALSAK